MDHYDAIWQLLLYKWLIPAAIAAIAGGWKPSRIPNIWREMHHVGLPP